MKVILSKPVPNVGEAGQVVTVKDGYARNFLLPQGLAQPATGQNIKYLESLRSFKRKKTDRLMKQAEELGGKLAGLSVIIAKPVGESERLFGTVTHKDIAEALKAKGVEVDRRKIAIESPIKSLGSYTVTLKLHAQVQVPLKVEVVKD